MGALAISDLRQLDGEPRILDLRLGEALGYGKPVRIRDVIRRNPVELQMQGEVFRNLRKTGTRGGRPETENHLNEVQAVLVCMFSRTPQAAEVRRQIAQVFLAYRHGELTPAAPDPQPPTERAPRNNARWAALEKRLAQLERATAIQPLVETAGFARALAYMPNVLFLDHDDGRRRRQRRPNWWYDLPVREASIHLHRQMTIDFAVEALKRQFGRGRTPSRSSLGRFWLQLDAVRAGS